MTYKIIYVVDLHGNKELYEELVDFANKKEIKAVVIGGDICPKGTGVDLKESIKVQRDFLTDFLSPTFKKCKKPVFLMMGNDDFRVNMDVLEKEEKKGTFKLLHNKLNKINNKNIVGYSFVREMPFLLKDWEKLDNEKSKHLTDPKQDIRTVNKEKGTIKDGLKNLKKLSNPKNTIYVIHSPPFDTNLDVIHNKQNVGSKSVREFIEKEQPFLTLHGHIHESPTVSGEFMDKIGETICINPGSEHSDNILNAAIIDLDNLDDIEHEMI
jgi:Icc-related predicted phosphoesterase